MQVKHLFTLMELKSLPNTDNRIELWRNTIQLFHSYKKINFNGPFFATGYTNYRIESPLSEKDTGNPKTPDIFACGPKGWLILELSCSDESKKGQLDSYKNLDPRSLSTYGCHAYDAPPDTICSRPDFNNDGDHCEIVVKDSFNVKKDQFIAENSLRDALINMKGKDLKRLPEIPFSLVPEMKHYEIRRGIVDIILQLFDGRSDGKTAFQMCEKGLERIFELIPASSKKSLTDKITNEMETLLEKELTGYLELREGKYYATDKFKQYPKSRMYVALKLKEWADSSQKTFQDFNM